MLIDVDPNDLRAPFPIERVYWMVNTKADRGGHAHRRLKQLAHCPVGGCTFTLDDGVKRWSVRLDSPGKALLLQGEWREIGDFTPDCVLLVLADAPYDEGDYIRDYDEFLADRSNPCVRGGFLHR